MLLVLFVRTLEPSIPTNYALITADTAYRVPTTCSLQPIFCSLFLLPYSTVSYRAFRRRMDHNLLENQQT